MQILIVVGNGSVDEVVTAPGFNVVTIIDKDVNTITFQEHHPAHPDGFDSLIKRHLDDIRPYKTIDYTTGYPVKDYEGLA